MANLSDAQLIMLSRASQRNDGAVDPAQSRKGGATAKVAMSLLARNLLAEIHTRPEMPVWRRDECGEAFSLVISTAGRLLIGVEDEEAESESGPPINEESGSEESAAADGEPEAGLTPAPAPAPAPAPDEVGPSAGIEAISRVRDAESGEESLLDSTDASGGGAPRRACGRAGTKRALVIAMLSSEQGAALAEIVETTSWLPHTARAALTVLRKQGFAIERFRDDGQATRYRISPARASENRVPADDLLHDAAEAV